MPAITMHILPKQVFLNRALSYQAALLTLFILVALPIVSIVQRANQRMSVDSALVAGLSVHFQGRRIDIDDGIVIGTDGRPVRVKKTSFDLGPCPGATYLDEPFLLVKPIENGTIDWQRTPAGIRVGDHVQPDVLLPESLRVLSTERRKAVAPLSSNEYFLEPKSGVIMASGINPRELEHVMLDYVVKRRRVCNIVMLPGGKLALLKGELSIAQAAPPVVPKNAVTIIKINAPPFLEQLSPGDFLPAQIGITHFNDFFSSQLLPI